MDFKPNNGVGLGMSVAENIARMHGGSLMISSSPDKGTTVTVSLPACGAELLGSEDALDYGDTNMANVLTALSPVLDYKKYAYFYE
jgi:cell cycle sensor histidine kinase DivJ